MEEDLKKLLIRFVGKKDCEPTKSLVVCIYFLNKNTESHWDRDGMFLKD